MQFQLRFLVFIHFHSFIFIHFHILNINNKSIMFRISFSNAHIRPEFKRPSVWKAGECEKGTRMWEWKTNEERMRKTCIEKYTECTETWQFKVAKLHTQISSCMHSHSCPPRDRNYSGLDFFLAATLLLALFASCVPWSPADSILRRFDAAGLALGSQGFGAAAFGSRVQ